MIHRDNIIQQPELDIYPLTIISDRYSGSYSGGKFTAWNMDSDDIPPSVEGGDSECEYFWNTCEWIVGKGNTPDEALEDLYFKLYKNK